MTNITQWLQKSLQTSELHFNLQQVYTLSPLLQDPSEKWYIMDDHPL